jgi:hypothetical protein
MWYGLKEDDVLRHVRFFQYSPQLRDFGVVRRVGVRYAVVVVRIREIGKVP